MVTVALLLHIPHPTSMCNNSLSTEQMVAPNHRKDAYATFATTLVDCRRKGRLPVKASRTIRTPVHPLHSMTVQC
jgi:hypothetical protein